MIVRTECYLTSTRLSLLVNVKSPHVSIVYVLGSLLYMYNISLECYNNLSVTVTENNGPVISLLNTI